MGFFNKLKNEAKAKMDRAAKTIAHPTELRDLDKIVNDLVTTMDVLILQFENDGTPPNEEQATAWEDEKFGELNSTYDERAKESTGRDPKDDKDSMSVRKRQLNRALQARRGKLFGRFSEAVGNLKAQAEAAIKSAEEDLAELDGEIEENLPMKPSEITSQYDALVTRVEENINSSFPDGVEGLDNYDDGLDCQSYADYKTSVTAAQEAMLEKAVEATAQATADYKQGILDAIEADLADDELDFAEDGGEEIKAGILESIKGALGVE